MKRFGGNRTPPGPAPRSNVLGTSSFRYRDFRFLWVSTFLNAIAMMGEHLVLGWLVLELSGSPFMVGVAFGLRMAPLFFLGIPAGAIADKVDRRHLIKLTNLAMAATTAGLGVLILLGVAELWHILVFTFVAGSLRALYQTARLTFAYDIVGPAGAVNGLALVTLGMWVGGLVGSLATGSLVARLGADIAYIALAGGYALAAVTLLPVRPQRRATPQTRNPVLQNLKEYFVEVRGNSALAMLITFTSAVEILGWSYQVLLPSLARDVLKVGAEGLGVMNAFRSVGGIVGIMVLSAIGEVRRKGLLFLSVVFLFGGFVVLLAFVSNFYLALAVLVLMNSMAVVSDILSQSMMQLMVPDALRGRAMGSWVLAVGTGPVGHLQIGAIASAIGTTFALTTNGAGLVVLSLIATVFSSRLRRL